MRTTTKLRPGTFFSFSLIGTRAHGASFSRYHHFPGGGNIRNVYFNEHKSTSGAALYTRPSPASLSGILVYDWDSPEYPTTPMYHA